MEFDRDKLQTELLKDFEKKQQASPNGNDLEYNTKKTEIDIDSEPGVPVRMLFPIIVLVIIVFGVYAWKTDKFAINSNDTDEVPVIKADTKEIRSVPADPGGMYIANRDKMVYEAISNNEKQKLPQVVQILPQHEEPISRDEIKQIENTPAQEVTSEEVAQKRVVMQELEKVAVQELPKAVDNKAESTIKVATNDAKENKKIVQKQELLSTDVAVLEENEVVPSEKPTKKTEPAITVADIKNVEVPSPKTIAVSEPKKNNQVSNSKGSKIQLGAFKTEADLKENWSLIKKKHDSLLEGLDFNIEKADLGDKGIFYRLQVGRLESDTDARKLCKELIEQNQGCFVVKK